MADIVVPTGEASECIDLLQKYGIRARDGGQVKPDLISAFVRATLGIDLLDFGVSTISVSRHEKKKAQEILSDYHMYNA